MGLGSVGGGTSKTRSETDSQSSGFDVSGSSQALDQQQLAMQQQLFNQYQGAMQPGYMSPVSSANAYMGPATSMAWNQTQEQQRLAQAQAQGLNGGRMLQGSAAMTNAGMNKLNAYSNAQNPYAQQQVQNLGADIGRMFNQQIMPGINSQFAGANQRGSSRHGIAQGMAAQSAMEQFQRGATDTYANSYNQGLSAANAMAGYANQSANALAGMGIQAGGQALNAQAQGAQLGIGAVDNLNNARYQSYMGQFMPMQIGAGIVGNPSVLGQSFGLGMNQSTTRTRSEGSGSEMKIGFG